jgi:hypothetical protein
MVLRCVKSLGSVFVEHVDHGIHENSVVAESRQSVGHVDDHFGSTCRDDASRLLAFENAVG